MVTWRRPQAEINFLGLEFPRRISIERVSSGGCRYTVSQGLDMPKIPTEYLDNVFYLYETVEDAEAGIEFGGSGFFVGVPSPMFPDQVVYTYAVTNWHTACRDGASVIRLNKQDDGVDVIDLGPHDWTFIPNSYDIAVSRIYLDNNTHRGVLLPITIGISQNDIAPGRHQIGVGDNIFMLGRFVDHDGGPTNQPAARFGNISVLPAPIRQPNGVFADSFCVDLHSRTGYSGSPVYVWRSIGDDLDEIATTKDPYSGRGFLKFLGILWGQFGEDWKLLDDSGREKNQIVRGMSGMSCVLPAWAIKEVLDLPKFADERAEEDRLTEMHFQQNGRPPTAMHPLIALRHTKSAPEV